MILPALLLALNVIVAQDTLRGVAIDERLAADAKLRVGDTVALSAAPGEAGQRAVVTGIVARAADPAEIARGEYKVR
ncbi:MAG: hypothetical protein ABIY52_05015, partial [Gemmatimonadaceae bacterium]